MIKYERWFKQIEKIINQPLEQFMQSEQDYLKIESSGFMDLNIDKLSENRIAMAHNYIQEGDVIPDPDMEVIINFEYQIVYPVTYQDSFGYREAYEFNIDGKAIGVNEKVKRELEEFFGQWLRNLKMQGFQT